MNSNVSLTIKYIWVLWYRKNYDPCSLLVDTTLQSVKSAFTTWSSGKTFILSSSISKISDVKESSSRMTESNLDSLEFKKSMLCASTCLLVWMQCGIGYAFEYVNMFPSERHLWEGLPTGYVNGTGLGIGLVKDGVVVVTATWLSTNAIVCVFLELR